MTQALTDAVPLDLKGTPYLTPTLALIAALAGIIAYFAPFDIALTTATAGQPMLRALVMVVIALAGGYFAQRTGLSLQGRGPSTVTAGLVAAAGVALWVILLDAFVFRAMLPADYVGVFHAPLLRRLAYFMPRAFNESVIYRLGLFSAALWLIKMARKGRPAPLPWVVAAMIATQMLNIGLNIVALSHEPITPLQLVYDALRYVAPGALWAWLYWRYGFVCTEIAATGCHIFLQLPLGMLI